MKKSSKNQGFSRAKDPVDIAWPRRAAAKKLFRDHYDLSMAVKPSAPSGDKATSGDLLTIS
jgi:hypothetical protein